MKDVVVIPRQEYEYLINFKKIKEFSPTLAQKKSLVRAENNFKKKRLYPTMNSSKSWDLQIDSSVLKNIAKNPSRECRKYSQSYKAFASQSLFRRYTKMKGEDGAWRRRIGSYRIFYRIKNEDEIILVFNLERRTSKTY